MRVVHVRVSQVDFAEILADTLTLLQTDIDHLMRG
jgi:hypothetical protein